MKKGLHSGVAVVITNGKKNIFYLQQKDKKYWIPEFKLNYCFFGGALNSGEDELRALKRELSEEVGKDYANIICKVSKKLFDDYFENILKQKCKFSLYEAVLSEKELKKLSKLPVKEGKRGVLIQRKNILKIQFISDLNNTLRKYLLLNSEG